MIKLKGNAIDFLESINGDRNVVLVHQVNCQGVMGSGIALEIKKRYPQHYHDYMNTYSTYRDVGLLSRLVATDISASKAVVGIFGQQFYGSEGEGKRYTNYAALLHGLTTISSSGDGWDIVIPKNIGCDRGGANWEFVEAFLKDLEDILKVNIYVVEYSDKNSWELLH